MDNYDRKRKGNTQRKPRNRDYEPDYSHNSDRDYQSEEEPFFKHSTINGNVTIRTNRAEDFFENPEYTPWDEQDDFNRINSYKDEPRKIRKKGSNATDHRKNVNQRDDELFPNDEGKKSRKKKSGITKNIRNQRKNRKLLAELSANKKPLSKRQRNLKNLAITGIIIGVILLVGFILSVTVLFKCENIVVEGNTRYDQEDIINVSELHYGENIFLASKSSAGKYIEAKYPYIETADITFSLPNTIKIQLTEAEPEYYLQDGTRFYIISKGGKILEEVVKRELDIPNIVGCTPITPKTGEQIQLKDERVMTVLKEIANCMEHNGVTGILEIDLSDMSNIELNYNDRIKIVLGMPEYIDYKIRTAMTIILNKLSESDVGRLNCSNLVEGRTDNKGNASYFQPNRFVGETPTNSVSIMVTEPATQFVTQPPTQTPTTEIPTEAVIYQEVPTEDDEYTDEEENGSEEEEIYYDENENDEEENDEESENEDENE
ncbi:MAG: FtsQ-type POTRA domain-containing protein [Clostridia bacterium]|nr:FtsQ-type POTRA domain-containing protein [Clostridia bacterium]